MFAIVLARRAGIEQYALVSGDLALTASTLTTGEITVEIARRQPDGSWLWAVDQPSVDQPSVALPG